MFAKRKVMLLFQPSYHALERFMKTFIKAYLLRSLMTHAKGKDGMTFRFVHENLVHLSYRLK